MKTITGTLTEHDKQCLCDPNYQPNTRDIGLKIYGGLTQGHFHVRDCYMGIQHRKGILDARYIKIESFVNDGIALQGGKYDFTEIDYLHINNDLDFLYSKHNHNDCIHAQTNKNKYAMHIKKVFLEVSGKGAADKGNFIKSETGINDRSHLFENGFKIARGKTAQPSFNSNNERNGIFGSPLNPLCGKKLNGLSFRIWGKKPNSPPSYNNVIHCYDDVKLELDKSAKKGTTIRVYKRKWTSEERLDNWFVYQAGEQLV